MRCSQLKIHFLQTSTSFSVHSDKLLHIACFLSPSEAPEYAINNPKSDEEIENLDNPKLKSFYIRLRAENNHNSSNRNLIHRNQLGNANISKMECIDCGTYDGESVSTKPREKTLKAVGVIGASVLAGLGLYHGAKKLYKKYKIARIKKKEKEQNKRKEED